MKRRNIIMVMMTSLLLGSCSSEDILSVPNGNGRIRFDVGVSQSQEVMVTPMNGGATRSAEPLFLPTSSIEMHSGDMTMYANCASTADIPMHNIIPEKTTRGSIQTEDHFYSEFGIFGYFYESTQSWELIKSSISPESSMKNLEVTRDNNSWTTNVYWPGGTKEATFFAYAPYNCEGAILESNTGAPKITYTVPSKIDKQQDLLIAKSDEDISCNGKSPVVLDFKHVLSAIKFVKGETPGYKEIKAIQISGINDQGTLNMNSQSWEDTSGSATYSISTIDENTVCFLMPQSLPSSAKLSVTLTNGGTEHTFEADLYGTSWQAGHQYTYQLSINKVTGTFKLEVTSSSTSVAITGGSAEFTVKSYFEYSDGTQIPVGWTATYRVDDETTELTGNSEYVTSFTSSNDNPNATATNLSATLDKLYFVSDAGSNPKTSNLREKSLVGTDDKHYNLSNQTDGGATVENTANCYIVNAPGYYRIPMVYGNGIKNSTTNTESIDKGNTFVNSYGSTITKAYLKENNQTPDNAVLVWQDAYHLIDPKSVNINGDFIEFYIPKKYICEGNAVLAARDASNNILWSWHIWVTGETIGTSSNVAIINRTGSGTTYNFMKLPLGFCHADTRKYPTRKVYVTITQNKGTNNVKKTATATIEQSSSTTQSLGVNAPYYQYGRKDPFCPSDGNGNTNKTLYDSQISFTEFKSQSGAVTTDKAIQNPHIFYYVQDSHWNTVDSKEFWDVGNSDNGLYDASTNKSVKSVYDPSPVGYKTPEPAAWTRFTKNGNNTGSSQYFNVANNSSTYSADGGWKFYRQADGQGDWDLWHALGFRDVYSNRTSTPGIGGLLGVGSDGGYWSCGPSATTTYGRYLGFSSGRMAPQDQSFRAYGLTVRPVSE